MKRVSSRDPEKMEYRGGGGLLILPGLLFGLIGSLLAAAFFQGAWQGGNAELGGVALGGLIAFVGCIFVLGRNSLEIDLRARSYRRVWSLLLPLRSRSGSLNDLHRVLLGSELRSSKHGSYEVFTVRLGDAGQTRIPISVERTYEAARRTAEDLAKSLRLDLVDSTRVEELVITPDRVSASLRERFQREGRPQVELPLPPRDMRSRIEVAGRALRIHIPPRGFRRRFLIPWIAVGLFETLTLFAVFLPLMQHRNFQGAGIAELVLPLLLGLVFLLLPIIVVGVRLLSQTRTEWILEASPEKFLFERRSPLRSRRLEIPSDQIEEIHIGTSKALATRRRAAEVPESEIILISREHHLAFGGHLPEAEKAWIRGVLEQVFSST